MEIIRYEYKSRSRKKNESRLLWIKKKEKKTRRLQGFPLPPVTWSAPPPGDLKFEWFIIQFLPSPLSSVIPGPPRECKGAPHCHHEKRMTWSRRQPLAYHVTAATDAESSTSASPASHLGPRTRRRRRPTWSFGGQASISLAPADPPVAHQLPTGNNTCASRCHGLMKQRGGVGGGGSRAAALLPRKDLHLSY